MPGRVFDLRSAGVPEEFAKFVASGMRDAGKRGLLSAAVKIVGLIQHTIIPKEPRQPVDRGLFRAGWRAEPTDKGADIVNSVPHALFVEEGVKAGNVKVGKKMIDALAEWVVRKGIAKKKALRTYGPAREGKKLRSVRGVDYGEARRIAWAIAMSMKKKGIFNGGRGLHILDKAMTMAPTIVREEVEREVRKLTKKI